MVGDLMKLVGIILASVAYIVLLIAFGAIVNGYVLSILRGWFILPFGLPQISIPWVVGLALVVSFLTYQQQKSEKENEDHGIAYYVVMPIFVIAFRAGFVLLFGYVVHQYM